MMSKYLRWYMQIIYRAQARTDDIVGERHHIVPKTLGGGNEARNLVKLTHKEHYLAHWLLVYIACEGDERRKMNHALSRMNGSNKNGRPKLTSWQYARARAAFVDAMIGTAYAKGKRTAETRARMSAAALGKPKTDEHRAKIGAVHKGKNLTAETRAKISAAALGKPKTAETRARMSATLKDKPWSPARRAAQEARKQKGDSHAG